MSKIFEALQKSQSQGEQAVAPMPELALHPVATVEEAAGELTELEQCPIFSIASDPRLRLVALSDESSLGAEKMRVLSTRLRHLRHSKPFSKLLVSSCMQGEGKSVVSANLAITLARNAGQRTLLIDGDFRQPGLSRMFSHDKSEGIGEWYANGAPIHRVLRRTTEFPLWFLPAGKVPRQPLELLQSEQLGQMITSLGERFDWVIVDSPPLAPMADSTVWAALTDVTLLVVREGQTPTKLLRKVVESFDQKRLIGVVVNESATVERKYYDLYYRSHRNGNEPEAAGPQPVAEPKGHAR